MEGGNEKMKFKIGDRVKFKVIHDNIIINYLTEVEGIPRAKLIHGNTNLGKHYFKHFAKVVDTHNNYYIVEYMSSNNMTVRLGFREISLNLVTPKFTNWKEEMKK